jgi:elongation factor P
MDPESYEQVTLDKQAMGSAAQFLKEDMRVPIRFHGEKALAVRFPETVDLKVASTGKGFRGQADSTYKPATLENGVEILVPQFIETGDFIRVEVATSRYVERLQDERFDRSVPFKPGKK